MSIDAWVVARMKGGVSSSVGSTVDGMVMIFFAWMNAIRLMNVLRKRLQQLVRRRMHRLQLGQHFLRGLLRIDFFRHPLKLRLVLVQIVVADLEQPVQRHVHHLVVQKLLAESVRANPEIAVRLRQQIGLQPPLVAFSAAITAALVFWNSATVAGSFARFECVRHVVLEEVDDPRQLFQCNLGVDARRIFRFVRASVKTAGICFSRAISDRSRSSGGAKSRSISSEGAACNPARIRVGILLPGANRLQLQQIAARPGCA